MTVISAVELANNTATNTMFKLHDAYVQKIVRLVNVGYNLTNLAWSDLRFFISSSTSTVKLD